MNKLIGNIVFTEKYEKDWEEKKKFNKAWVMLQWENWDYKIMLLWVWFSVENKEWEENWNKKIWNIVKVIKKEEKTFKNNVWSLYQRDNGDFYIKYMWLSYLNVYSKDNNKDKENKENKDENYNEITSVEDLPF